MCLLKQFVEELCIKEQCEKKRGSPYDEPTVNHHLNLQLPSALWSIVSSSISRCLFSAESVCKPTAHYLHKQTQQQS